MKNLKLLKGIQIYDEVTSGDEQILIIKSGQNDKFLYIYEDAYGELTIKKVDKEYLKNKNIDDFDKIVSELSQIK